MELEKQKFLLIADDSRISDSIEDLCLSLGCVLEVRQMEAASVNYASKGKWDVIFMQADSNQISTLEACKHIKHAKPLCQLFVTSEKNIPGYISSFLYQGADDFIVYPWNKEETLARTAAAVRRHRLICHFVHKSSEGTEDASATSQYSNGKAESSPRDTVDEVEYTQEGDVQLYPMKREITVCDKVLNLTKTEYELLAYLLKNKHRPCSSVELLNNVLGYEDENYLPSLHSHVSRIRRKLNASQTTFIDTIWCYGYRLIRH